MMIAILLSILACKRTPVEAPKKDTPPNIVFIFADDQTYASIGALGNPEIHTPNLDRLVREGTTLPTPIIWAVGMGRSAWPPGL